MPLRVLRVSHSSRNSKKGAERDNDMRKGLIISLALHLLILLSAVAVFPFNLRQPQPRNTPLPVDLVTPAQFTKIKAGQRTAKAEKKPEAAMKKAAKKRKSSKVKLVKAPAPKPKPKRLKHRRRNQKRS